MRPEQLRERLQASPFRPFTIHMANGRSLHVRHPEMLSVSPGGRSAVVWSGEESFDVIDVMLVTSLEFDDGDQMEKAG